MRAMLSNRVLLARSAVPQVVITGRVPSNVQVTCGHVFIVSCPMGPGDLSTNYKSPWPQKCAYVANFLQGEGPSLLKAESFLNERTRPQDMYTYVRSACYDYNAGCRPVPMPSRGNSCPLYIEAEGMTRTLLEYSPLALGEASSNIESASASTSAWSPARYEHFVYMHNLPGLGELARTVRPRKLR